LTGEELDATDLNAVKIGTLSEVGNIVVNGVMGSIANVLEEHLDYGIPVYLEDSVEGLLLSSSPDQNVSVVLAQARFEIEQLHITGDIILIFTVASFDSLLQALKF
jgi:chemotaxis protein CheC